MTLVSQSVSAQTYNFVGAAKAGGLNRLQANGKEYAGCERHEIYFYNKSNPTASMAATPVGASSMRNLEGYNGITSTIKVLPQFCNVWFRQITFHQNNYFTADKGIYTNDTDNGFFVIDSLSTGDQVIVNFEAEATANRYKLTYMTADEANVKATLTTVQGSQAILARGDSIVSDEVIDILEADNSYIQLWPGKKTYIKKITIKKADGDDIVYDYVAVGKAKLVTPLYTLDNVNGSTSNGGVFNYWQNASNPDKKGQSFKGYKFPDDEEAADYFDDYLPEESNVWFFQDRFNQKLEPTKGLRVDRTNNYLAIGGLKLGSTVKVTFTTVTDEDNEVISDSLLYVTGESAGTVASIDGEALVAGESGVKSGKTITISKSTNGYIVLLPTKGMYIETVTIDSDITSVIESGEGVKVYDFNKEWLNRALAKDATGTTSTWSYAEGDYADSKYWSTQEALPTDVKGEAQSQAISFVDADGNQQTFYDFRGYTDTSDALPEGILVRGVRPVVEGWYDVVSDENGWYSDYLGECGYLYVGQQSHEIAITGLKSGNAVMLHCYYDYYDTEASTWAYKWPTYVTGEDAGVVADIDGEEVVAGETEIVGRQLINITEAGEGYIVIRTPADVDWARLYQVVVFDNNAEASDDDDPTTGIQTITNAPADGAWYTIQGLRVAQPTKGLYIHNGKKVVIK